MENIVAQPQQENQFLEWHQIRHALKILGNIKDRKEPRLTLTDEDHMVNCQAQAQWLHGTQIQTLKKI